MEHQEQVAQIKLLMARLDSGTTVDTGGFRHNPTSVYVDPELAQREWDEFFAGHPQMIGLTGDVPEPGSFVTVTDLGVPILATRDDTGRFRAFVNSCRHRGVVIEERPRGQARRFTCPFHSWTYDPAGTLVGLPNRDHFGAIDLADHGLVELPAVEQHGLLFVHPDPAGSIDVDTLLGQELAAELAGWAYGELEYLAGDDYDVACNWKLAMDTFGETYHFPNLHRDTINQGFHGNVQGYDTYGRHHRMLLVRRGIDELRDRPEDEWDITLATLPVYWLFPNVQLMPFQDGCYLVRAYPVPGEPGRHISRITFYVRPGVDRPIDEQHSQMQLSIAEMFARIIRDEDYVVSASQQRSAEGGGLPYVVFGRNEPALHHYHNTYRSALGVETLPLLADQ